MQNFDAIPMVVFICLYMVLLAQNFTFFHEKPVVKNENSENRSIFTFYGLRYTYIGLHSISINTYVAVRTMPNSKP